MFLIAVSSWARVFRGILRSLVERRRHARTGMPQFRSKRRANGFSRMLIALLVGFLPLAAEAEDTGEFGLQLIDIANKYTAAIISAKICGEFQFQDQSQEARFTSNRELSRVYASRIFIEDHPGVPIAALIARAEQMDRTLDMQIRQFHAERGCSHELISAFLKWFRQFKEIPRQPFPKADADFGSFKILAINWLAHHY